MEQIVAGRAQRCAEDHGFRGYIHLKTIPDASPEAVGARPAAMPTGSAINIELPTDDGLGRLAPEKDAAPSGARWAG